MNPPPPCHPSNPFKNALQHTTLPRQTFTTNVGPSFLNPRCWLTPFSSEIKGWELTGWWGTPFTWRGPLDGHGKPHGRGVLVHEGTGSVHEGAMVHGRRQGAWVIRDAGGTAWNSLTCTDDVDGPVKVGHLSTKGWGEDAAAERGGGGSSFELRCRFPVRWARFAWMILGMA